MRSTVYVAIAVAGIGICGLLFLRVKKSDSSSDTLSADRLKNEAAERQAALRANRPGSAVKTSNDLDQAQASKVSAKSGKRATSGNRFQPGAGGASLPNEQTAAEVTKELDSLLDKDDDSAAVLAEARRLMKHPNAEVRSRAAFALHWTGMEGLGDLTSMLADPDPEVVRDARDYWQIAVASIDSSADKAALLDGAYQVTGDDTDNSFLNNVLSEFTMLEDIDAGPRLAAMLKDSNNPEHNKMIMETLDFITQPDEASENKTQALNAYEKWQREKAAEQKAAEEMAAEQTAAAQKAAEASGK